MNIAAKFNGINYPLQLRLGYNKSSKDVKFTNISIDFTGKGIADLPVQFQEVQILNTDTSEILFTGYVSKPIFPDFHGHEGNTTLLLDLELLSPLAYASKRSYDGIFTEEPIKTAVEDILSPLVNQDGYTIEVNTLPSTKYLSETYAVDNIANIMSNLAYRFNFLWYIDEAKKIYIYDLNTLVTENATIDITNSTVTIDGVDYGEFFGFITPSFESSDYANKINFTNFKLISNYYLIAQNTVLKQGNTYNFTYPFSISENTVFSIKQPSAFVLDCSGMVNGGDARYQILSDYETKTITYGSYIGFAGVDDDNTAKRLLLIRDYTNPDLITGFKWNYTNQTLTYDSVYSDVVLLPYFATFVNPNEINIIKDKSNTSGIIEKTINCNGKHYAKNELSQYAEGFFKQAKNAANEVNLIFRGIVSEKLNTLISYLNICTLISIDYEKCFISKDKYIITDFKYEQDGDYIIITIDCRRSSYNESFIDIFRASETQKSDDLLTKKMYVVYNQENDTENAVFAHEILVNDEVVN